jgi:glycogen debranching enzyme
MNLRLIALLTPLCAIGFSLSGSSTLDQIGIEVRTGSRPFVYTNKEDASYYGETHSRNRVSWQGFMVHGHEFLDDYEIVVNGTMLDRSSALKVMVYPDHLERTYPGGLVEELWPVDSLALVGIHLRAPRPVAAGIIPYFTDGRLPSDYNVRLLSGVVLLARTTHLARTPSADYPVWLAIGSRRALPDTVAVTSGRQFSPVRLLGSLSRQHIFAVAVANSAEQAEAMVRTYPDRATPFATQRRARMQRLLDDTEVQTSDPRFNLALSWAVLSLDALIMNQTGKGIFAGLPWFNNYWGRDTFISLPGAALVTERFPLARQILESFAAFQQRDSLSSNYGRIPNIVTVTDTAYNTADGTPRFVDVARDYVLRSGDEAFLLRMYPIILRSIEGTLKYHTDSLGFLTHGDADTWMDAVGPSGAWSPRGNRANDIQALWAKQLEAGVWCASRLGDFVSAHLWNDVLRKLKLNFTKHFVAPGNTIVDRLLPDGSADMRTRPNQLFTAPLLDAPARASMVHSVASWLTYHHGVASLAQTDSGFYPYHEYSGVYPKDAAYHNGTVWTWLQGQLISVLCRYELPDSAFVLTTNAVHQIIDRGAVGTQSELLDALPRPGEPEPRLSGTVSQAWNLAEFVRNVYDDYLGVRIERFTRRILLRPHLPRALGGARTSFRIDGRPLGLTIGKSRDTLTVAMTFPQLDRPYAVDVTLPNDRGEEFSASFALAARTEVRMTLSDTLFLISSSNPAFTHTGATRRSCPSKEEVGLWSFAQPRSPLGLHTIRGPAFPLLSHADIKRTNERARVIATAIDAPYDDTGIGAGKGALHYSYPANPDFVAGAFDITGFSASCDDSLMYFLLSFRRLSDPGWHPEYGFQLTFAAIAIDTDGTPGVGRRDVPANAQYRLDPDRAYERIVFVGGGFTVEDQAGNILAGYTPGEDAIASPFGDARTGRIRFAIPLRFLGTPDGRWKFTILGGGQDDHGGAGIGEFRTVQTRHRVWNNGGGRVRDEDSNVYDLLLAP